MKKYIAVAVLMLGATLASAQTPTTSREYYQEIKDAGGIPKWAVNVCFMEHLLVDGKDAGDMGVFMLTGETTKQGVVITPYPKGIAAYPARYKPETANIFIAHLQVHGKPVTATFRINWSTNRFTFEFSDVKDTTDTGMCEGID
jgi:hypothetical protein